jgi:CDP-glycerol glycerophosphotransferase
VGNARNVGVNLAQGEFLIFIDSDDWCSMMVFEKVQELLEHHNYPDCGIFSYNRYQDGDYLHNTIPNQAEPHNDYNALVDNDAVMSLFNKGNICASPWNKVYKRSFWLKNDISWPTAEELKELQVEGSEDF